MRIFAILLCLAIFPAVSACGDAQEEQSPAIVVPLPDAVDDVSDTSPTDTVEEVAEETTGDSVIDDTVEPTYEDDCGDGKICILGECLDRSKSTSCIAFGQCCEDPSDDCAFGNDGCFCDADCVAAGDCCPDACAACGFCNDDGGSVSPSCADCVAKDCGDCAGCEDVVSPCDQPGDDCSEADIQAGPRCAVDDAGGHSVEICTKLDSCWRWTTDTLCESLNFCTQTADICVDGACVADGDSAASCPVPTDPCMYAVCDPGSGDCSEHAKAENAPCTDDSVCTAPDKCFGGSCIGTPLGFVQGDPIEQFIIEGSAAHVIDLAVHDEATDALPGYGCDDMGDGYSGNEVTIEVKNPWEFGDFAADVYLELDDPDAVGVNYVDLVVLPKDGLGTCWPDSCAASAMMGDDGRLSMPLDFTEGGQVWWIVLDGRDGYEGAVRLVVNFAGVNAKESFCGDGLDEGDLDGPIDCDDSDCYGSGYCASETACGDGADNDMDDLEDCLDDDCFDSPYCLPEQDCEGDGDTDGDGLTGCDDEDCNGVGSCGQIIECPDAIPLACSETLVDQSVNDGSMTFGGVQIDQCGEASTDTYNVYNQQVYQVTLPANCTSFSPKIDGNPFAMAYAFGPNCTADSCNTGGSAGFPGGADGAVFDSNLDAGWIVVAVPDFESAGAAGMSYDITLECGCN